MRRAGICTIYILTAVLIGCHTGQNSNERKWADRFNIEWSQQIGAEEEDWITGPVQVNEDSNGNIYVSDFGRMKILVFGSNHELLREIGSRGRMDGQFLHLTSFMTDPNGDVVVFDNIQAQSTQFSSSGELIRVDSVGRRDILWPRRTIGEVGSIVSAYKLPDADYNGEQRTRSSHLVHSLTLGKGGYEVDQSMIPVSQIIDTDLTAAKRMLEINPGYILADELKEGWYVPPFVSGSIYRYGEDLWPEAKEYVGWIEVEQPYQILRTVPSDSIKSNSIVFTVSRSKRAGIILKRESLGLFRYSTDMMLHFYSDRADTNKPPSLIIDAYDIDGQYMFSQDITDILPFVRNDFGFSPTRILHLSRSNMLYVSGLEGEDTVQVFSLRYD